MQREPVRVELAQSGAPPVVNVTVVEPAPLVVTERTCEREGLTVRAFAKVARAMRAAGFKVSKTSDGPTVMRADLERYFAEHAPIVTERSRDPKPANDADAPIDDDDELARAGGFQIAGRRR